MSIFKKKKNDLYLSDKQPLTVGENSSSYIICFLNIMGSDYSSANITNYNIII